MIDEPSLVSRKQSASDLQSRLKTRKLLGVGELARDNGDIYKSKISQLLGINESLYVRLPKGLLYWNTMNTLYFYIVGTLLMLFPKFGIHLDNGYQMADNEPVMAYRLYGVVLFAFGLLFRSILVQRETRSEIATLLLAMAIMQFLQLGVCYISNNLSLVPCLLRIIGIIGNLVYHSWVDAQGGVFRQIQRGAEEYYSAFSNSPTIEIPPRKEVPVEQPMVEKPKDE